MLDENLYFRMNTDIKTGSLNEGVVGKSGQTHPMKATLALLQAEAMPLFFRLIHGLKCHLLNLPTDSHLSRRIV